MTLPDDDGTHEAEVARFKRRRKLKLAAYAALALVALAVGVYYIVSLFPGSTTLEEDLVLVQLCKLDRATVTYGAEGRADDAGSLSKKCRRAMLRVLKRLRVNPGLCARIASKIAREGDWERKNRLLLVLLQYRRSQYPVEGYPTPQELQRHPCLEEPLVHLVHHWSKNQSQHRAQHADGEGWIPGVATYNARHLRRTRFLVINAYVLKRTSKLLPPPAARRFAVQLLAQIRRLYREWPSEDHDALKKLFDEVFYPVWEKLGKPAPK